MTHKKKISEKVVLDNNYRKIISKEYDVGNWIIYNYLIAASSNAKYATIAFWLTKDEKVIYIKEYREWVEDYIYSFSMWVYEENLSFEENAKKELQEETGYIWWYIYYLWETITANYEDLKMRYFFIDNCEFSWQNLEQWEDIEVFTCSLEEFEEKIKSGFINCPLTITCFTLAKLKGYV